MSRTHWIALAATLALGCTETNESAGGGGAGGNPADGGVGGMGGAGGTDCVARLTFDPDPLVFPRDGTTGPREHTLTVHNNGDCAVPFESVTLSGSQAFQVRLDGRDPRRQPEVLVDPDGDGRAGLGAGRSANFKVLYSNPDNGAHVAELSLWAAGEARTVSLRGDADGRCLRAEPTALTFPPTGVGGGSVLPLTLKACGDAPVQIEALRFDGAPGFEAAGDPPREVPASGAPVELPISFRPRMEGALSGRLLVLSDDPLLPQLTVQLLGRANTPGCPQAVIAPLPEQVTAGTVVLLDGSLSQTDTGSIAAYEWTIIERPAGGTSAPVESYFNRNSPADGGRPDDVVTPQALFSPDLPGRYTVRLRVTDNLDVSSEDCGDATVSFLAVVDAGGRMQVQLVWRTPDDGDGTDLDLQLLHPQAGDPPDGALICDADNPTPDWGDAGPAHDPVLDVDDVDGGGPENIVVAQPQPTADLGAPYRLRVRYVADAAGSRPVVATVRLFAGGALVDERSSAIEAPGDFWEVGSLPWPTDRIVPPEAPPEP